jgi:hypothetical protein
MNIAQLLRLGLVWGAVFGVVFSLATLVIWNGWK